MTVIPPAPMKVILTACLLATQLSSIALGNQTKPNLLAGINRPNQTNPTMTRLYNESLPKV